MTQSAPDDYRLSAAEILALLSRPGWGPAAVLKLMRPAAVDTPEAPPTPAELEAARRTIAEAEEAGIGVVGFCDPHFPEPLRSIPQAPVVLFFRGNPEAASADKAMAVIGTRQPSPWAYRQGERLAARLADEGYVVVSGLALGCDTAAHSGCLEAGGRTVAVLAHGLDSVYPKQNAALAERICEEGGCLISEYAAGVAPAGHQFVQRDRLQSGLSRGVIVIQTDLRGGSMKTVAFAHRQHRPVACLTPPPEEFLQPAFAGNVNLIEETGDFQLASGEGHALADFLRLVESDTPVTEIEDPDGQLGLL
jgi:DNA processing protein